MSDNEIRAFQRKLAEHTAPSLLGIKCACLVSISKSECEVSGNVRLFNSRAAEKGLKIRVLSEGERCLMLLYSESRLSQCLSVPERREILRRFGYTDDMTVGECLDRLSERLRTGSEFPHEIGVFLDYPTRDVLGFIENKGKNFKLCGCWKVYSDEERAAKVFENYDKCRRFLRRKLSMGEDLYCAIPKPNEHRKAGSLPRA